MSQLMNADENATPRAVQIVWDMLSWGNNGGEGWRAGKQIEEEVLKRNWFLKVAVCMGDESEDNGNTVATGWSREKGTVEQQLTKISKDPSIDRSRLIIIVLTKTPKKYGQLCSLLEDQGFRMHCGLSPDMQELFLPPKVDSKTTFLWEATPSWSADEMYRIMWTAKITPVPRTDSVTSVRFFADCKKHTFTKEQLNGMITHGPVTLTPFPLKLIQDEIDKTPWHETFYVVADESTHFDLTKHPGCRYLSLNAPAVSHIQRNLVRGGFVPRPRPLRAAVLPEDMGTHTWVLSKLVTSTSPVFELGGEKWELSIDEEAIDEEQNAYSCLLTPVGHRKRVAFALRRQPECCTASIINDWPMDLAGGGYGEASFLRPDSSLPPSVSISLLSPPYDSNIHYMSQTCIKWTIHCLAGAASGSMFSDTFTLLGRRWELCMVAESKSFGLFLHPVEHHDRVWFSVDVGQNTRWDFFRWIEEWKGQGYGRNKLIQVSDVAEPYLSVTLALHGAPYESDVVSSGENSVLWRLWIPPGVTEDIYSDPFTLCDGSWKLHLQHCDSYVGFYLWTVDKKPVDFTIKIESPQSGRVVSCTLDCWWDCPKKKAMGWGEFLPAGDLEEFLQDGVLQVCLTVQKLGK
eukprot:TRINITY_DN33946_c0_g1_i1.p1 TRINITY_DN33946_c0_g1~~TRINITY_DN33946_c0_g1_i1.p1  ORF type:complete len:630 (+),score=86.37 TRINITY_DN33946_c0_g1_i1:64-1953(+)